MEHHGKNVPAVVPSANSSTASSDIRMNPPVPRHIHSKSLLNSFPTTTATTRRSSSPPVVPQDRPTSSSSSQTHSFSFRSNFFENDDDEDLDDYDIYFDKDLVVLCYLMLLLTHCIGLIFAITTQSLAVVESFGWLSLFAAALPTLMTPKVLPRVKLSAAAMVAYSCFRFALSILLLPVVTTQQQQEQQQSSCVDHASIVMQWFQSILVTACCLVPHALGTSSTSPGRTWGLYVGWIMFCLGWGLETMADMQLISHRRRYSAQQASSSSTSSLLLMQGLWAYGQHPNWTGQMLVWFASWCMNVTSLIQHGLIQKDTSNNEITNRINTDSTGDTHIYHYLHQQWENLVNAVFVYSQAMWRAGLALIGPLVIILCLHRRGSTTNVNQTLYGVDLVYTAYVDTVPMWMGFSRFNQSKYEALQRHTQQGQRSHQWMNHMLQVIQSRADHLDHDTFSSVTHTNRAETIDKNKKNHKKPLETFARRVLPPKLSRSVQHVNNQDNTNHGSPPSLQSSQASDFYPPIFDMVQQAIMQEEDSDDSANEILEERHGQRQKDDVSLVAVKSKEKPETTPVPANVHPFHKEEQQNGRRRDHARKENKEQSHGKLGESSDMPYSDQGLGTNNPTVGVLTAETADPLDDLVEQLYQDVVVEPSSTAEMTPNQDTGILEEDVDMTPINRLFLDKNVIGRVMTPLNLIENRLKVIRSVLLTEDNDDTIDHLKETSFEDVYRGVMQQYDHVTWIDELFHWLQQRVCRH